MRSLTTLALIAVIATPAMAHGYRHHEARSSAVIVSGSAYASADMPAFYGPPTDGSVNLTREPNGHPH